MSEDHQEHTPPTTTKKKSDQSKLKARLRDLEFFTEVIPDGVVIINSKLLIEATNESAQSLLGLPEDSTGKPFNEFVKVVRLNSYVRGDSQQEPLEFTSPVQKDSTLEARLFNVDKDTKVVIVRDITTAVAFLHRLGYVHCDIKLDNCVVTAPQVARAKLIDFGSVRKLRGTRKHTAVVQTRSHRAPEVHLGSAWGSITAT